MMTRVAKRAEEIARRRQRDKARQVARHVQALLAGASVEIEEARVIVSGRGIVKRWLIDPSLRFLAGGLK